MESANSLLYGGLDFVITDNGWFFLEANDHPVLLSCADRLARLAGGSSIFEGEGIMKLATAIASRKSDGAVCLLLPDFFVIDKPSHALEQITISEHGFDDERIEATISEFNALRQALQQLGVESRIVDANALVQEDGIIKEKSGHAVGALYRRSFRFPTCKSKSPCFNDLRLRSLCVDKNRTHELVAQHLPSIPQPAYHVAEDKGSAVAWLNETCCRGNYAIVKPRCGSASHNVERVQLQSPINPKKFGIDWLWQEWIKPKTTANPRGSFYFDIRLFVVANEVVGGFARRAAAACTGVAADSPLAWLTTTGPIIPLCHENSVDQDCVGISDTERESIFQAASDISGVLDKTASNLMYSNESHENSMKLIKGRFRHIYLR